MVISERTGKISGSLALGDDDEIIAITSRGRMIRILGNEIRSLSRFSSGSRIIKLDEGDTVVDVSVIKSENEDNDMTVSIPFDEEANENENENI